MFNVWDWFMKGGFIRKVLVLGAAFILFTVIAFFLIQSGLTVVLVVVGLMVVIILAAILAWRHFSRTQYVDLMEEAYLKMYRSTMMGVIPVAVSLIIKKHENATIQSLGGMVMGRTMLPIDESVEMIKEMGEPKEVERKVYTEDNKTEVIKEENILWVFRVKQPSQLGGKTILCIIADSQISELSRDATGDLEMGTTILAYGNWIQIGKFYVLWNKSKHLEKAIVGLKTTAIIVALEHYINRLAQITAMDIKTKQELLEKKEVGKHEEEAVGGK